MTLLDFAVIALIITPGSLAALTTVFSFDQTPSDYQAFEKPPL